MNYTKVADYDYLVRDEFTGAIINTDKELFDSVKKSQKLNSSLKNLYSDVEYLKNEISDIKHLLTELLKHGNT
jgi:septal ring factor EnvC (AmiA/AmiB activator)